MPYSGVLAINMATRGQPGTGRERSSSISGGSRGLVDCGEAVEGIEGGMLEVVGERGLARVELSLEKDCVILV